MGISQFSMLSSETDGLEGLLMVSVGPAEIAWVEATRGVLVEDGLMPLDAQDVG